jgi:DNA-binding transcriptional LysR family regulator
VLLPRALALMSRQLPHVSSIVREGSFESLLPELRARNIHLIVGTLIPSRTHRDLEEEAIDTKPLTLVARCDHPLTKLPVLDWRDLEQSAWVLPPEGAPLRLPLEEVFAGHAMPVPQAALQTSATHLIRTYVSMTDAIAFMPSDAAQYFDRLGILKALPIHLNGLVKPTGVIWSKGRPLEAVARRFIEILKQAGASDGLR